MVGCHMRFRVRWWGGRRGASSCHSQVTARSIFVIDFTLLFTVASDPNRLTRRVPRRVALLCTPLPHILAYHKSQYRNVKSDSIFVYNYSYKHRRRRRVRVPPEMLRCLLLLLSAAAGAAKGCTAVQPAQCGTDWWDSCLKCGPKSDYDCEKCCPGCKPVVKAPNTYCDCSGPPAPPPASDTWFEPQSRVHRNML